MRLIGVPVCKDDHDCAQARAAAISVANRNESDTACGEQEVDNVDPISLTQRYIWDQRGADVEIEVQVLEAVQNAVLTSPSLIAAFLSFIAIDELADGHGGNLRH